MTIPSGQEENPYAPPRAPVIAAMVADGDLARPIELGGPLSKEDLAAGIGLLLSSTQRIVYLMAAVAIVIFAIVIAAGVSAPIVLTGVAAAVVVLFLLSRGRSPHAMAEQLASSRIGPCAPMEGTVDGHGLHVRREFTEGRFAWQAFAGWMHNGDVLVFVMEIPNQFVVISRSQVESESEWRRLLALVASKLPKK
jgi:hypothetical protein